MDDYKRSLYMFARRQIETKHARFVCRAFFITLCVEGSSNVSYKFIGELFPEFARLNDGLRWKRSGKSVLLTEFNTSWWTSGWKKPRLRALDCILRD